MVLLIDTREKSSKHLTNYWDSHKIEYESLALPSGDYSFKVKAMPDLGINEDLYFYQDIVLERKNSLEELSGCFAQTRERFNDEWSRCYAKRRYLLIENATYEDLVNGKYNTQYSSKSFLGSLHSFNTKYDLQIMFMPNKEYSAIYILGVFQYYLRYLVK
jgi:ERCC4-type nuclease